MIALGVKLSTSNMTDSNSTTTTIPVLETFNVKPYTKKISPSTDSGSKLYLKENEPYLKYNSLKYQLTMA